jgi:hypothetical protein
MRITGSSPVAGRISSARECSERSASGRLLDGETQRVVAASLRIEAARAYDQRASAVSAPRTSRHGATHGNGLTLRERQLSRPGRAVTPRRS